MRRSQTFCWGLVVSISIASGCSTAGRPAISSWLRGKSKETEQQDEQLASDNPFRRPGATESNAETDGPHPVTHDAETKRLIETELADASPEERKNLTTDFRTLDPLVVKQILKLRRLRIELEQQKKQQFAHGGSSSTNEPYRGLGAAYPGGNRASNETRFRPNSDSLVRPVAATQDDLASGSAGQDFGHSLTFAKGADIPVIKPRVPDVNPVIGKHNPGESLPQHPEHTPRTQFSERPIQPAMNAAFTSSPESGRETIPVNGQNQMNPPPGGSPPVNHPHGQQPSVSPPLGGAARNPLQIAGIDTSQTRQHHNVGMLNSPVPANSQTAEWYDGLQRLIAMAEEQAYVAQVAWEQADQLGAGSNIDEPTRRQMAEARREDFVEKQVDLRLLYLMAGQQARALERVRGLEPADQEFWTQVMWSLANYFDLEGIPNRDDRATQTVTQMRTAIQHLQETAKLEIRNVDFCTKISSFGDYEPFDNNVFRPGQPVMVYAEIENFASDRGSDGIYRTQLKSTIEVHRVTPQGSEVIDTIDFDPTTDLCRNHRRDYYHSYKLQIPAKSISGSYALVLIVEDQFSKRVATYSRNFTVE